MIADRENVRHARLIQNTYGMVCIAGFCRRSAVVYDVTHANYQFDVLSRRIVRHPLSLRIENLWMKLRVVLGVGENHDCEITGTLCMQTRCPKQGC